MGLVGRNKSEGSQVRTQVCTPWGRAGWPVVQWWSCQAIPQPSGWDDVSVYVVELEFESEVMFQEQSPALRVDSLLTRHRQPPFHPITSFPVVQVMAALWLWNPDVQFQTIRESSGETAWNFMVRVLWIQFQRLRKINNSYSSANTVN